LCLIGEGVSVFSKSCTAASEESHDGGMGNGFSSISHFYIKKKLNNNNNKSYKDRVKKIGSCFRI
jgi:hypothetical protein